MESSENKKNLLIMTVELVYALLQLFCFLNHPSFDYLFIDGEVFTSIRTGLEAMRQF